MPKSCSYHRPLLSLLDPTRRKGTKIFRFDRRLRDNMEVRTLIKKAWDSVPHLHVEEKLSHCRSEICKWSKKHYEDSRESIEKLHTQLDNEMSKSTQNQEVIYQINRSLLQAYVKEEEFWKQRSRQLWLTLGNSNTSYFHAMEKGKKARNRVSVIEDDRGVPWFEEEQIAAITGNLQVHQSEQFCHCP